LAVWRETEAAVNAGEAGEAALWQLVASGDQPARERIFALYQAFARTAARRHYRQRSRGDLELADLEQYAFEGLLDSIDRFDPERGVPFAAFATRRIAGNIVDGIRRANEMREQLSWSHRIRRDRIRSLGPDENEPAPSAFDALAELAVGLALGFMLEGGGLFVDPNDLGGHSVSSMPLAWTSLAWTEMKELLAQELANVSSREQTILKSHYLQGMAFEHIAVLLGLSKGRISQLHRGALATLRRRMAARGHFQLEG
jgi:RNA polymerase sigma factor for flagellar operon FliA